MLSFVYKHALAHNLHGIAAKVALKLGEEKNSLEHDMKFIQVVLDIKQTFLGMAHATPFEKKTCSHPSQASLQEFLQLHSMIRPLWVVVFLTWNCAQSAAVLCTLKAYLGWGCGGLEAPPRANIYTCQLCVQISFGRRALGFFRWDISVICPIIVLKLAATVFTSLPFRTLWPN